MNNTRKYTFTEIDILQMGNALRGALKEKSPLKLTIARAAKTMEESLSGYINDKQLLMETIVAKDGKGNLLAVEGLKGEPQTILDYQLLVSVEEATNKFEAISNKEIEVELPVISEASQVVIDGEKISLEEYLDQNPDASGHLAYIYLKLTT